MEKQRSNECYGLSSYAIIIVLFCISFATLDFRVVSDGNYLQREWLVAMEGIFSQRERLWHSKKHNHEFDVSSPIPWYTPHSKGNRHIWSVSSSVVGSDKDRWLQNNFKIDSWNTQHLYL